MKFGDIRRLLDYETVIEEVVDRFKAAKNAKVGDEVVIPNVRTRVGKQLWQVDEHKMRRLE